MHFMIVKIDLTTFQTAAVDSFNPPTGDINTKWTKKLRVKEEMIIHNKQWSNYKLLGVSIYNIVWGHYDDTMRVELRQKANFANANTYSNTVGLLNIIDKVCLGGNLETNVTPSIGH